MNNCNVQSLLPLIKGGFVRANTEELFAQTFAAKPKLY